MAQIEDLLKAIGGLGERLSSIEKSNEELKKSNEELKKEVLTLKEANPKEDEGEEDEKPKTEEPTNEGTEKSKTEADRIDKLEKAVVELTKALDARQPSNAGSDDDVSKGADEFDNEDPFGNLFSE